MHAVQLLHNITKKSCVGIHSNRLNATFVAVDALVKGTKLSLAGLGRSIKTDTKVKNNIKRIDRLLGNIHLHAELESFYKIAADLIIGNTQQVAIIIDWSSLPSKDHALLRAAIPTQGRSFTIYEEVHPIKKQGNHVVHKNFLAKLKQIIPTNCMPVTITDAGFHSPFFGEVEKLGWNWVGRIRNLTKYKALGSNAWISCKELHKKATNTSRFICAVTLSKSTPINCAIYTYKGKKKNRIDKNKSGVRKKGNYSRTCARANKEPWVLATSLHGGKKIAKKIVTFYKRRMQIEEGFRDMKNSKFGFGLEHSKSYKTERLAILLLIAMLAILAVCLIGKAAEQKNIQYDFQANTIRTRAVLSLFFLGCQIVNQGQIEFKKDELVMALMSLRRAITNGLED